MYFADAPITNNFFIYKGLLDKYLLEKQDDEIKEFFKTIIVTTHKLIVGDIKESEVDHKIFNLVAALSDFEKKYTRSYFFQINPNDVGIDQFRSLSSILSSLIASEMQPANK